MIPAREAYTRVIFGATFGKYLDKLVKDAIKSKSLYFNLPLNSFPAGLDIDDVLPGLILLGYTFERIENEGRDDGYVIVGFNFTLGNRRKRN